MEQKFSPVTHVIFDMDGLLLNTEERYDQAAVEMCRRYGKEFSPEARQAQAGTTAMDTAKAIINIANLPLTPEAFLEEIESLYEGIFEKYIDLMPGALRLVKHLKENNIPICIATSSKESTFKLKAKHHGENFFPMFRHIVKGSDDPEVKNGKPAPDIFLIAASRFEDPPTPDKCLVFEDSVNGVKAGMAAGMQVVWVPDRMTDRKSAEATIILDSLESFRPELFGLPPFKD